MTSYVLCLSLSLTVVGVSVVVAGASVVVVAAAEDKCKTENAHSTILQ